MAKTDSKDGKGGFVQRLTPRDVDFAQWYTDVVTLTDLCDYAPIRGCMVIKPYGTAIWERIQEEMDRRFKATGHENVMMPMLIPESLLLKEAEHVEGFAPEVAWVTQGGKETLQEKLAIRPTSEVLFSVMYAKWLQSWRDLPLLYNQWCSVMRWEKTTRPFLRTSEFWWQEGHTLHETAEEAQDETMRMLDIYRQVCEDELAMPVYMGMKSESEKFAGAVATYSIEAMMQDGKSLQAGTSHNFGDNFTKAYDITFLAKDGRLTHPFGTSWGTSTRLIGALIMAHGDERGLKLPPRIAPYQVVVVPVAQHKEGVMEGAKEVARRLEKAGVRVKFDGRDTVSPGFKFNEWELKGVPVRLEVGPRDLEAGQAVAVRRDTYEKTVVSLEGVVETVKGLLESAQASMFGKAKEFMESRTETVKGLDGLKEVAQRGFARAMWCGEAGCEEEIKAKTGAGTRNMPFDQTPFAETCVNCGKPARYVMYFAKAY
ncbi:MAG: proline--tRNA ligase [Oscillospiraceae bacterium]|jgi:prolyl-tRNA synthetase|nr:proline--tRNA ligase [Oscillospiraceae bacterium]